MALTKIKNTSLDDADLVALASNDGSALTGVVKTGDIGSTVQGYDATIMVDADIGSTVEAYDATILKDADIGSTVEAYDATILKDADIGSTVEAYYSTGYESLPILKSANYTAVPGDTILVTAGSITITLPASPTAGDTVIVKDGTGAADVTNWTVGRNGSNIASSASDLTFDKNWAELCMTYINATIGWSV
jgi:NDP-sugar pyrophosphorylase family protein